MNEPWPADDHTANLIAAALFLGPCGLGIVFAALSRSALRQRLRLRRGLLLVTFGILFSIPFLVLPKDPRVSLYDALSAAALFSAAATFVGWPARFRLAHAGSALLFIGLLAAGLALVQWWFVAHPVTRTWGVSSSRQLLFTREQHDYRGALFYGPDGAPPGDHPPFLPYAHSGLPAPVAARRVMHLGDSMLESAELPGPDTATRLLEAKRPGETHYNLGVSATGPDFHFAILQRYFDRLRPAEVVEHVFPGNDVGDMDHPYAFCDGGPILDERLAWRCPAPAWRMDAHELFRFGPPPYPLRIAARHYQLFERIEFRFEASMGGDDHRRANVERGLTRLREVLAAEDAFVRARGAIFRVVVLPVRPGYFQEVPVARDRVLQAARASGAPVFDSAPAFEEAMRKGPDRRWFQPSPGNPHLDVDGERLYAEWLDATLWPKGAGSAAPAPASPPR